jgi:hypothetical protein
MCPKGTKLLDQLFSEFLLNFNADDPIFLRNQNLHTLVNSWDNLKFIFFLTFPACF